MTKTNFGNNQGLEKKNQRQHFHEIFWAISERTKNVFGVTETEIMWQKNRTNFGNKQAEFEKKINANIFTHFLSKLWTYKKCLWCNRKRKAVWQKELLQDYFYWIGKLWPNFSHFFLLFSAFFPPVLSFFKF